MIIGSRLLNATRQGKFRKPFINELQNNYDFKLFAFRLVSPRSFCFVLSLGFRFDPQSKCSIKNFRRGILVLETHPELREEEARRNNSKSEEEEEEEEEEENYCDVDDDYDENEQASSYSN
jgi:hypothetical protein